MSDANKCEKSVIGIFENIIFRTLVIIFENKMLVALIAHCKFHSIL